MATVTDTTAQDRWEKENAAAPLRKEPPTTRVEQCHIDALYTPADLTDFDPDADLGYPGQYPFRARRACLHVPVAALDHAPVRRLRVRRSNQ